VHGAQEILRYPRRIDGAGSEKREPAAAAMILRITNDGYNFLEASKQPMLWQPAKERIKSAGLPVTIAVAKTVLEKLINDSLAKLH
jgi:hypothetical protein